VQSNIASKHSTPVIPVISLLIAATLWGIAWYPLRIAENYGMAGLWTTVLAYSGSLVVGLAFFRSHLRHFRTQPLLLCVIALVNGWLNVAFILAVIDGNVIRVILLFYLSPVWSTLLGWLVLKEHISGWSLATLIVAMTGAMTMLWDPALGFPWPQDYTDWLAITAGMAFSVSNVTVRKLQDVSIGSKTLAAWFGVTLVASIWIVVGQAPVPTVAEPVWGWVLFIGTLMVLVMTLSVQYGVTHLPVYQSAIILLFELIAAALSSQWLSDEVNTAKEWIGGSMILLAGYLSARAMMKIEKAETSSSG